MVSSSDGFANPGRRRAHRLLAALLLPALALAACHTMRFEVADRPAGRVVQDRKAFFLWGLVPTKVVDVGDVCPHGAAAVEESTTFGDGFLALLTLGLYAPRTSTYHCLPAPGQAVPLLLPGARR